MFAAIFTIINSSHSTLSLAVSLLKHILVNLPKTQGERLMLMSLALILVICKLKQAMGVKNVRLKQTAPPKIYILL